MGSLLYHIPLLHFSKCPLRLSLFLLPCSSQLGALTCQGAGGCRDPKETSGGQKQGPHIDTDLTWVAGSEVTVQGHLRGTEGVSPLQREPPPLP